jgi:hypothetical protein
MTCLIAVLCEPLLRLIRLINSDPLPPDFPTQWALAVEEATALPPTLAIGVWLVRQRGRPTT